MCTRAGRHLVEWRHRLSLQASSFLVAPTPQGGTSWTQRVQPGPHPDPTVPTPSHPQGPRTWGNSPMERLQALGRDQAIRAAHTEWAVNAAVGPASPVQGLLSPGEVRSPVLGLRLGRRRGGSRRGRKLEPQKKQAVKNMGLSETAEDLLPLSSLLWVQAGLWEDLMKGADREPGRNSHAGRSVQKCQPKVESWLQHARRERAVGNVALLKGGRLIISDSHRRRLFWTFRF